jgi:hypothetical protein
MAKSLKETDRPAFMVLSSFRQEVPNESVFCSSRGPPSTIRLLPSYWIIGDLETENTLEICDLNLRALAKDPSTRDVLPLAAKPPVSVSFAPGHLPPVF